MAKYFILDLFRTHYSEACRRLYAVMVNYNDIKFVKVDEYDLLYCRIAYLSYFPETYPKMLDTLCYSYVLHHPILVIL